MEKLLKEIELLNEKLESLGILGESKEEILKEFIKIRAEHSFPMSEKTSPASRIRKRRKALIVLEDK